MGLLKDVESPSGVPLGYHRVVSVSIITNNQNVIEVASYVSKAKRLEELAYGEALVAWNESKDGPAPECRVFTETAWHEAPYDPLMDIAAAYGWLKGNVAAFERAEDDLGSEGGDR